MRPLEYVSRPRAERRARLRSVAKFLSKRAAPAERPLEFPYDEVAERIGGTDSIPYGLAPRGSVVGLSRAIAIRHGLVFGASGSGKTRYIVGQFLRHIDGLLGRSRDHGIAVELTDPKGELAPVAYAAIGRRWAESGDEQRDRLESEVRVFDSTDDLVTPTPLFDREAAGLSVPYLAELRVQVEDEGADVRSTDLTRHVRTMYYQVLIYLKAPLDYSLSEKFLNDPIFRGRILQAIPDRDLRLYWTNAERTIPRQTVAALLRFIQRRLAYPNIRLAINTPPEDVRRLLGPSRPCRFTIGCFSPLTMPAARAMEQARLRVTDACTEAAFQSSIYPQLIWIDEVPMLFHRSDVLEEVLSLGSRTLRSRKRGLVLCGQDFSNAITTSLFATLKLNAMWFATFRSEPDEAELVFPFVHPADPAVTGTSDAERKRSLARHIANLPTREHYLVARASGAPAMQLTALPMPDPAEGRPESEEELVEIFMKNIARRSMVRKVDAEEAIASWQARTVDQAEVAPGEPDAPRAARSLRDLLDDIAAEEDVDGPN